MLRSQVQEIPTLWPRRWDAASTGRLAWRRWRLLGRSVAARAGRASSRARTPTVQILLAVGGMLGGAALISRVALGIMLIVGCLLIGVDGLLREAPSREEPTLPDAVERWRRAR